MRKASTGDFVLDATKDTLMYFEFLAQLCSEQDFIVWLTTISTRCFVLYLPTLGKAIAKINLANQHTLSNSVRVANSSEHYIPE
jgi:hypothetical protein